MGCAVGCDVFFARDGPRPRHQIVFCRIKTKHQSPHKSGDESDKDEENNDDVLSAKGDNKDSSNNNGGKHKDIDGDGDDKRNEDEDEGDNKDWHAISLSHGADTSNKFCAVG